MRVASTTIAAVVFALAAGCKDDTITVKGMVVNHLGIPLSGVHVAIGKYGEHWPVYTQGDGRFTMNDVKTPYDAEIGGGSICGAHTVFYQGLTRSDPVLTLSGVVNCSSWPSSPWKASIAGALSGGGGFPQPGHAARVAFGSQDFFSGMIAAADGTFSSVEQWYGRDPVSGDLHALQWQEDGNGLPSTYTGYGARPGIVLTDGASLTGQDIALGPVGTGQVSGTATVPAGFSLTLRTMALRVGEYGYLPIVEEAAPSEAFAYEVPQLAGSKIAVRFEATSATGDVSTANRALAPGTSGVSMALPAAVTLLQPAAGATGVTPGALFEWTPFPGGVHILGLAAVSAFGPYPVVTVVTAESSFSSPPNPGVYCGMPCGPNERFVWSVSASTRYPTVDAAAGGPIDLGYSAAGAFDADFGAASSGVRELQTAP